MAQIKLRRDTYTNWFNINPILANGEPAYDTTNNKIKVGDGTTNWQTLSYLTDANTVLPANSAGYLSNNGSGVLSWVTDNDSAYLTTETDPVFTASAAANVTTQKITNWDTAYGWGDHSLSNYLTKTITTFTGTIAGTTLTVTNGTFGTISYGQYVEGAGVLDDTFIIEQLTSVGGRNGGNGTYSVSVSQNIGPISMHVAATFTDASIKLAEGHGIFQQDEHDLDLYNLLIGIQAEEATIHIGDINTNGVSLPNNKEYKVDSGLNPGTYMAVAKVDATDNVFLSSGNSASTVVNVGGVAGNTFKYGAKFFNGGEAHIPVGLRIGNNTNAGNFGAALEITTNAYSGASFASYKDSSSDHYGSFVYGSRFGSPLEQLGSPSPVVAEDWLMEFGAAGWDGASLNGGGELAWRVDGTVTAGVSNPSRAEIYVTAAGSVNQTLGLVVHSTLNVQLFGGLNMPALSAAPSIPVASTVYVANGVDWFPGKVSAPGYPYPVFYDGNTGTNGGFQPLY